VSTQDLRPLRLIEQVPDLGSKASPGKGPDADRDGGLGARVSLQVVAV